MERSTRMVFLWLTIMVGYCVHTLIDLLPVFFGGNVAIPGSEGVVPGGMYAFTGMIMFLLPVAGLLLASYGVTRPWRMVHLVLSALVLLANIFHLGDLFTSFNWGQCMVLPVILLVNVLLVWEAARALKSPRREQQ